MAMSWQSGLGTLSLLQDLAFWLGSSPKCQLSEKKTVLRPAVVETTLTWSKEAKANCEELWGWEGVLEVN